MSATSDNDRFERAMAELQRMIEEEERIKYSRKVREHARHPQNLGRMDNPDAHAVVLGWCGDMMEIYLRIDGERVQEATFITDGCGPSMACGNMGCELARGLVLSQCEQLVPSDLIAALDGLPEDSVHCAELAVDTLHKAVEEYRRAIRLESDNSE